MLVSDALSDDHLLLSNACNLPQAVIALQRRCPNARVMYVSATGASEAENLCYMERLGLWGPGSAFPNKAEFVGLLKQVIAPTLLWSVASTCTIGHLRCCDCNLLQPQVVIIDPYGAE